MRIKRFSKIEENTIKENINLSLLEPIINKYKNLKGSLIPLLQETQKIYGYLPHSAFIKISQETDIKLSDMFGVATFYAQFRLQAVGKYIIRVCHGTACHVQNADSITEAIHDLLGIKDGETTKDGLFTLETVACLGCCSLAPVIMINDNTYGKLNNSEAIKIIKNIELKEKTII